MAGVPVLQTCYRVTWNQIKHSCQMNSFRHAFRLSHKKCNFKFSWSTQYHLPIWKLFSIPRKLFASSLVDFRRFFTFCTSALRRIWRASRLVAPWACGRLWSWKVLNDALSNTGSRSKKMERWNTLKLRASQTWLSERVQIWLSAEKQVPIHKN